MGANYCSGREKKSRDKDPKVEKEKDKENEDKAFWMNTSYFRQIQGTDEPDGKKI